MKKCPKCEKYGGLEAMAWRLITVTQLSVTKYGELRCRLCDRRLEVGEEAWSHLTQKRTQYYCKGCYRKL